MKEENTYTPKGNNSVPSALDTQFTFDGFPAAQQEDGDDLLKPDPNFTYPTYQKSNRKAATNKPISEYQQ